MTTSTLESLAAPVRRHREPAIAESIPMSRILGVELRKMFDTRSGFWLMASIGVAAVLATTAVILFGSDDALDYETFASAIGFPMAVILPLVAILSVTSEWSQRSGLVTFTLVPHRGRVIGAKAICAVAIGVVSMLLAAAVGAVGNIVGTAITGVDTTWNVSLEEFALIVLANVLGLLVGFMLAVVIRSSAGAIVAYFAYSLLLPTASSALASTQEWWRDNGPWVDFNYASSGLFNEHMTSEQWAQLATSGLVWLIIPLAIGLRMVLRSEVK
jgi:ABC-2 type transport system permease protein